MKNVIVIAKDIDKDVAKDIAVSRGYNPVLTAKIHEGYDYGSNAAETWLSDNNADKFLIITNSDKYHNHDRN